MGLRAAALALRVRGVPWVDRAACVSEHCGDKPELPAEQWAAMRWVPPHSIDHAQLYNRVASLQTLYENHIRNWSAAEGRNAHSGKQRREHLYGPAKPAAQSPVRRGYNVSLHCHFRSL